jgi:hypothetical protein
MVGGCRPTPALATGKFRQLTRPVTLNRLLPLARMHLHDLLQPLPAHPDAPGQLRIERFQGHWSTTLPIRAAIASAGS